MNAVIAYLTIVGHLLVEGVRAVAYVARWLKACHDRGMDRVRSDSYGGSRSFPDGYRGRAE